MRVRGVFLGVATLGFSVVAPGWLFQQRFMSGQGSSSVSMGAARLPISGEVTTARGLYYVCIIVVALTLIAMGAMRRTFARRLIAVRDNPTGAAASGLPPATTNIIGFATSGFIASVAGSLFAYTNVHFDAGAFNPTLSLAMLAMVVVGGLSSTVGPVLGAIAVFGVPLILQLSSSFVFLISGASLLVTLVMLPGGIAALIERVRDRVVRRAVAWTAAATIESEERSDAPALDCRGITVRFGGLVALDDVTITVNQREIVGLIGANGAGKTTLMDCISGSIAPNEGTIRANGRALAGLPAEFRSYAHVGRTFQDARLYPGLTLLETLLVSLEPMSRPTLLESVLRAPWQKLVERQAVEQAEDVMSKLGLTPFRDTLVAELPTGIRRTSAVAAVLLQRPHLVLLDEPTAGIPHDEVDDFIAILLKVRDELDCAILLIEHDMALIMRLCDRLYALEAGRVIASGAPDAVRNDPAVVRSYVGVDLATIDRSAPLTRNGSGRSTRRVLTAKKQQMSSRDVAESN
jgi:ABC-type branched-subunit amino acid transport system ATPase component